VKYEWLVKIVYVISLGVLCVVAYFLIKRGANVLLAFVLLIVFVSMALKGVFHESSAEETGHD
jgi:hypothetical protein